MTEKQLEDMTLDELRVAAEQAGTGEGEAAVQEPDDQVIDNALDDTDDETPAEESLEQVRARLASAEKALKDTQAWGTKKAQEAADLRRAQEEASRAANKPQILDVNPELADAIRYVQTDDSAKQRESYEQSQHRWQNIVRAAIPDIDSLLDNDDFLNTMKQRAAEVEWDDPIIAIRELNTEIRARAAFTAQQSAQSAKAEQKRSAISIPSGGAKQTLSPKSGEEEQLRKFQSMSSADFAREVRRISLGQ